MVFTDADGRKVATFGSNSKKKTSSLSKKSEGASPVSFAKAVQGNEDSRVQNSGISQYSLQFRKTLARFKLVVGEKAGAFLQPQAGGFPKFLRHETGVEMGVLVHTPGVS